MPALPLPLNSVVDHSSANFTDEPQPLQVICAFPVSGQYGAGSRILYYVLVTACILARKTEWLRNACLAAGLIFPAIASVHAIVLTALHVDGAVDLDIYGALQFCAIGVLTAPTTVRLSKTYFENKGRGILFVWSLLVLAGLVALAVEFFRTQSVPCADDGSGQPIFSASEFPYGETTCGLVCSVEEGPFSPMRDGSADNIYVVPAPSMFGFGAATLIAAACCIPGVLSMVSTWNKIVRSNWAKQFGVADADEVIEGTNGATVKGMDRVNDVIRRLLGVVEVPVFAGMVFALILVGELNFWSDPLIYETEPFANVSQWSGVAGAVFAACGSLYMLMAEYLDSAENGTITGHAPALCGCPCHDRGSNSHAMSLSEHRETLEMPRRPELVGIPDADLALSRRDTSPKHSPAPSRTETYPDRAPSANGLGIRNGDWAPPSTPADNGVAGALMKIATAFGTASPDRFDDYYAFRQGKATGFPEVPGERGRNIRLTRIKQQWDELNADDDDGLTPRGGRSRASSFGAVSRANSVGPGGSSLHPLAPTGSGPGSASGPSLLGLATTASPELVAEAAFAAGSLVEAEAATSSAETEPPRSQSTVVTLHQGPNSPAIVLSSEDAHGDSVSEAVADTAHMNTEPMETAQADTTPADAAPVAPTDTTPPDPKSCVDGNASQP